MKKLSALFLTLAMLLCLTACGGEAPAETTQAAAAPETQTPAETAAEPEQTGTEVATPLFAFFCDEEKGWIHNPETSFDVNEDRSVIDYLIPSTDPDRKAADAEFYVSVYNSDSAYYRSELYRMGFDPEVVAAQQEYDYLEISGNSLVTWPLEDRTIYLGRNVGAGKNLYVRCVNRTEEDLTTELLNSLSFTLEDKGETDPPLFSQGQPFIREDHTAQLGSLNLTGQQLVLAEPLETYDIFDIDVEIMGDKIYLLSSGTLTEFKLTDKTLEPVQQIPLPEGDYDTLDGSEEGLLLVSGFMTDLLGFREGKQIFSQPKINLFTVAPDGTWGLDYFYSGESAKKVNLGDFSQAEMPVPVKGLNYVGLDDRYLYACGSATEGENKMANVYVFDHSVKQKFMLTDEDGSLGAITFVSAIPAGFVGLDANIRQIILWNGEGTWQGILKAEDLFGTDYPWMAAADWMEDGSLLVAMAQERDDASGDEVVFYRITGLR